MEAPAQSAPAPGADARARVEGLTWYHTIELPGDIITDGFFDHRPDLARYELPDDLSGVRALDVGLQDGFWAFQLEARGAQVTGIDLERAEDLDWPPRLRPAGVSRKGGGFPLADGTAFRLARELLASSVERVPLTAYEAGPERLGTFDLVFVGSVLVHLRDPMLALERLASVCTGRLILCEPYSRRLSRLPGPPRAEFTAESPYMTWWLPSLKTWTAMIRTAGFEDVERRSRFQMRFSGMRGAVPHAVYHANAPRP